LHVSVAVLLDFLLLTSNVIGQVEESKATAASLPGLSASQATAESSHPNGDPALGSSDHCLSVPSADLANCDRRDNQPDWTKIPPLQPTPRPGLFLIPPGGPGYYSLRDVIEGNYRSDRPVLPWAAVSINMPGLFNNDFRYLDNPDNTTHDIFDPVKRIHLGDSWLLSIGGEERFRYMNEVDSQLTGKDNDYELLRTRVYADLWYKDVFRIYAEYLDAQRFNGELPPVLIDENRSDMLDFFIDLKVAELDDKPVYIRGGRQELLYGSQRLISPPDWANTRRTFEGVKAFRDGDTFDIDLFWVQPVIPSPSHFDSVERDENFSGIWTTYKIKPGTAVDFYYLNLDQARHVAIGQFKVPGAYNVSTFGLRCSGDWQNFLWDSEDMCQFGTWSNQTIAAAAATIGLGYRFADLPLTPQFWIYNDWASGSQNPLTGTFHGTFNQLFPFGHYYFGYLDLVGRQNIDDLNQQLAFFPAKWITVVFQNHVFRLDSAKDALYNAAGVPIRIDPTGKAGTDVGDEIDFTTNFHLSRHQDILIGYSQLFSGSFIKQTGNSGNPELFYAQYSFRW
jgi:hypothetical protein